MLNYCRITRMKRFSITKVTMTMNETKKAKVTASDQGLKVVSFQSGFTTSQRSSFHSSPVEIQISSRSDDPKSQKLLY